MLNILTDVTSGLTVEEVITLLESFDATVLNEQITRFINWLLVILGGVASAIALIKYRFDKLKAKFQAINWKEKGDNELKRETISEMLQLTNDTKQAVLDTYKETKNELDGYREDNAMLKELLPLMIKGGTFDNETLIALGGVINSYGERTSVITDTFKEELEKQLEATEDTTSILDKDNV